MIFCAQTTCRNILFALMAVLAATACGGAGTASTPDSPIDSRLDDGPVTPVTPVAGWSEFTPTAADTANYGLLDLRQPGSRLFYISTSDGNDDTAMIYFWDGQYIIDEQGSRYDAAGNLYGTDPANPSGMIRPFRSWAHVAPRNDGSDIGTAWDGGSSRTPGAIDAATRYGYPDWWLFKRGDTFDLYQDFLDYARRWNPNASPSGTFNLAVSGGRSATERQIVGAYGALSQPRPRFINAEWAFIDRRGNSPTLRNVAYLSLHLDGRGPRRGRGLYLYGQDDSAQNILIEDCWFDGTEGLIVQVTSADVTIRRSIVSDSWKTGGDRVQGLYFSGHRDAVLRIEESIFLRNGFTNGDPERTGWPPTGSQVYDIFSRNLYLSGECDNMNCWVVDTVSMIGASGDQVRPGMRIERNFFYQGYFAMGADGGYQQNRPTGTIVNNVFQRFRGTGTNDNRGHPGWGIELTSGSANVEVSGNIMTSAQHTAGSAAYSVRLSALYWFCYDHRFRYPTRSNLIRNNIFDSIAGESVVIIADGQGETCGYSPPGVTDNAFENNIMINQRQTQSIYRRESNSAPTGHDTRFASNLMYRDRSAAAAANGWPAPDRTLRSYLQSLGYTVRSDDGFIEYHRAAIEMRRGYWRPELTAPSIVNYIRQGFALDPVP